MQRVLDSGERILEEEIEILLADVTRGFITLNAGPIREADGRVVAAGADFDAGVMLECVTAVDDRTKS